MNSLTQELLTNFGFEHAVAIGVTVVCIVAVVVALWRKR